MTREPSFLSLNFNKCKIDREYAVLAHGELKLENDDRQKRIASRMITKTRGGRRSDMNHLQKILLEEMLETVVTTAGLDLCPQHTDFALHCPRARPSRSYIRAYCEELDRRVNINDAVEIFGREINGYNPLFVEYLENYALYNSHREADISFDAILTMVYGSEARETHLHSDSPQTAAVQPAPARICLGHSRLSTSQKECHSCYAKSRNATAGYKAT